MRACAMLGRHHSQKIIQIFPTNIKAIMTYKKNSSENYNYRVGLFSVYGRRLTDIQVSNLIANVKI